MSAMIPEAQPMLDQLRILYSQLAVNANKRDQAMDCGNSAKIAHFNRQVETLWAQAIELGTDLVVALYLETDVQESGVSVLEYLEGRFNLV